MDAEGWLTRELASFGCAACGQAYGKGHIHLIAQREELYFVDLSCQHCGSQAVAIVTIELDGERATLEGGELVRAPSADIAADAAPDGPPISTDDVLDAHEVLKGFEGDVHQLIARFRGEER
jgi:hypothetical protein